jgi:hypothetical protein
MLDLLLLHSSLFFLIQEVTKLIKPARNPRVSDKKRTSPDPMKKTSADLRQEIYGRRMVTLVWSLSRLRKPAQER